MTLRHLFFPPAMPDLGRVELSGDRQCVHLADAMLCVPCERIVPLGRGQCPLCESKALIALAPILSGEARLAGSGVRR